MTSDSNAGFAAVNNAKIYYEISGSGTPFVMIHAGVADLRQWNNEFASFASNYRVLRYDQRGFGKSEPVDGDYSYMGDLESLLEFLNIHVPMVLMGCSMGGATAMDFSLTHPSLVKALIMVDSGPSGLDLDVPENDKFAEAEKAFKEGDLDLVSEIETQLWFDGTGRTPQQVDQEMRKLLFEMNRIALGHEVKNPGKRKPHLEKPAAERLHELLCPVLVIVGANDEPYSLAAADHMVKHIKSARKVVIDDAAHLPNMEHPQQFHAIVSQFLDGLGV
jgi:pimeloyl-ACP methyl ester carboxylesterase